MDAAMPSNGVAITGSLLIMLNALSYGLVASYHYSYQYTVDDHFPVVFVLYHPGNSGRRAHVTNWRNESHGISR